MPGLRCVGSALLGVVLTACQTPVPPSAAPTASPAPVSSPVAISSPSPTALPSLPAETAAHLKWTKAKTNLPPRVAHGGLHIAMRPDGSPRYAGVDAFNEVLLSDDGVTWQIIKAAAAPGPWTIDVALFGDQLVAFDRYLDYMSLDQDGQYAVLSDGRTWLTTDGREWSRHPSPFAFVSSALDSDRLVATGGVSGDYVPTFATSTDASTWTLEPQAAGQWSGDASCWWNVSHLAGSSTDGFVVSGYQAGPFGAECGRGPAADTTIWRSTDLRSWAPTLKPSGPCYRVYDIVHGPRGFVAVGAVPTGVGRLQAGCAWASRDGIAWALATTPPPVVTSGVEQLALAPDGTFLAFGDEIWESTDGVQWFMSAPATTFYVYQVAGDLAVGCADDTCYALRVAP
jgi:hypothetical protein